MSAPVDPAASGPAPAIRVGHEDTGPVVRCHGELDLGSGDSLDAALGELGGEEPTAIFDLTDVAFVDSAALAVIIRHYRRLEDAGSRPVVALVQGGQPAEILRLTEAAAELSVVWGLEEARLAARAAHAGD